MGGKGEEGRKGERKRRKRGKGKRARLKGKNFLFFKSQDDLESPLILICFKSLGFTDGF